MNSLEKYTISVVESVGLSVDDDLCLLNADGVNPVMMDNLKLAIPTKANLENQNKVVDGLVKKQYNLFNPFSEDELKKNDVLTLLQRYMSAVSSLGVLQGVMQQLVYIASNDEAHAETSTKVKMWVVSLKEELGGRNTKNVLDNKTIKGLNTIINHMIEKGMNIITYRVARGETIAGVKYARVAKLDLEVVEYVKREEFAEELKINDKAKTVFLSMLNFILVGMEDMYNGSKSKNYPSFIALLGLYNEVQTRINYLLEDMKDSLDLTELVMPLVDESINVEEFKSEIDNLPNSSKTVDNAKSTILSNSGMMNSVHNNFASINTPAPADVVNNTVAAPIVNNNNSVASTGDDEVDYIKRLLGTSQNEVRHGFVNNGQVQVVDSRFGNGGVDLSIGNALNQVNNGFGQPNMGNGFNQHSIGNSFNQQVPNNNFSLGNQGISLGGNNFNNNFNNNGNSIF